MLTLNPLAAALQGIGFGAFLVALQGLWEATTIPAPLPIEALGSLASGLRTSAHTRRRGRRAWRLPYEHFIVPSPAVAVDMLADEEEEELEELRCIGVL